LFVSVIILAVMLVVASFDNVNTKDNRATMASAAPLPMAFCPWDVDEARAYEKETGRKPIIASCF
jgi:hypothetical protein